MADIEFDYKGAHVSVSEEGLAACTAAGIDLLAEVKAGIDQSLPRAEMYSKPNCGYCVKAKALFEKHGIQYEEISAVDNFDVLIDRVTQATGARPQTVPQIFIDGAHIGGHDQLVVWLQENVNAVRQDEG